MLLKLDLKNAFISVYGDTLLNAMQEWMPEYYGFLWQYYRGPSYLLFGEHHIMSRRGVQQGDPLGPLAFSITTFPLAKSLTSDLNVWYLADGTIGGAPETVLSDLRRIIDSQLLYGLELNLSKCEIFIFNGTAEEAIVIRNSFKTVAPELKVTDEAELCLLGSPLSTEALPIALEEKRTATNRLTANLHILQSHQALFLLKNCLSVPKLQYLLRTSAAWKFPDRLAELDLVIRSSLERITNTEMTTHTWKQASIPVSRGGLGIRSIED